MARLAAGIAGLVVTTALVHKDHVDPLEQKVFTMVNDLPDRIYTPVWLVMQLGALGAAPATGAAAWVAGNRQLAFRLVAAGSATWALSKVVKRLAGRPRPASLLPATHVRGSEAAGLGYLSGHAGVAVALGGSCGAPRRSIRARTHRRANPGRGPGSRLRRSTPAPRHRGRRRPGPGCRSGIRPVSANPVSAHR